MEPLSLSLSLVCGHTEEEKNTRCRSRRWTRDASSSRPATTAKAPRVQRNHVQNKTEFWNKGRIPYRNLYNGTSFKPVFRHWCPLLFRCPHNFRAGGAKEPLLDIRLRVGSFGRKGKGRGPVSRQNEVSDETLKQVKTRTSRGRIPGLTWSERGAVDLVFVAFRCKGGFFFFFFLEKNAGTVSNFADFEEEEALFWVSSCCVCCVVKKKRRALNSTT